MEKYQEIVKRKPYNVDAHYQCALEYERKGKIFEAYEQYSIALELAEAGQMHQVASEDIANRSGLLLQEIEKRIGEKTGDPQEEQRNKQWVDYLVMSMDYHWGIRGNVFHAMNVELLDKEYMDYVTLPKLYVGYASEVRSDYCIETMPQMVTQSVVQFKAELQRMAFAGNKVTIESDRECFLPVIMEENSVLTVDREEKSYAVPYRAPKQYVHYRIPEGRSVISSEQPFRLGKMIPIGHDPKRKRLVLNIFVDGLSQTVLREDFAALMPYTQRFFERGMICNHAYTAGDWTYPSLASIVTGQTMVKHQMLHSQLLRKMDIDTPILYEYFHNAGYNTTKIGGNWRITPNYGYARGMNRVLYQHHYIGYPAQNIVSDVIEQMYGMRDTDQFIWMEIGELHQIADQNDTDGFLKEFALEEIREAKDAVNSVKQSYDPVKVCYYLEQIKRIDRKLAVLYQYIEDHFKDEEILVTLFSDHGQGYLIKPEEEFLSDGRSNVAFMVRGNDLSGQTEEVISTCDYTPILCELAGIPYCYEGTDAHLPQSFGGTEEREFAISESLHVGDPYQIALKGKDFTFYLRGEENVTTECLVPLKNYSTALFDETGKHRLEDEERIARYTAYCLDHIASSMLSE